MTGSKVFRRDASVTSRKIVKGFQAVFQSLFEEPSSHILSSTKIPVYIQQWSIGAECKIRPMLPDKFSWKLNEL